MDGPRLSLPLRRPRPHRDDRPRRPHPRPDRAGAVHRAGRARDAAGLRQRPARAGVRAQQHDARGDDADARPGRAAAAPVAPDRGAGGGGRERRRRAAGRRALRRAARPHARSSASFAAAGERRHEVPLLRPAPAGRASSASARANAIEFLEVLDHAAPPGAPRQHTLFVRLLRRGFDARRPTTCASTAASASAPCGIEWCAPADALPPQAEAGLVDAVDDLPRTLVVRTDGARRFLDLHAAPSSPSSGSDQPPAGFDPKLSSIEFSFKVECPSDFDCAQHAACPPAPRAQPGHRLSRQGLPGLPPPDARPAEPARAGLDRTLGRRSRHDAGRAARLCGRQSLATARTRSPTRPISPPRASASRCAATPGWSTTACTRAAMRAPSCTSTSPGRTSTLPGGTQLLTARAESAGRGRAGQPRAARRASRPARWCSRPRATAVLDERQPPALLHLGRPRLLPAARHDARDAARPCRRAQRRRHCSSSRKS